MTPATACPRWLWARQCGHIRFQIHLADKLWSLPPGLSQRTITTPLETLSQKLGQRASQLRGSLTPPIRSYSLGNRLGRGGLSAKLFVVQWQTTGLSQLFLIPLVIALRTSMTQVPICARSYLQMGRSTALHSMPATSQPPRQIHSVGSRR